MARSPIRNKRKKKSRRFNDSAKFRGMRIKMEEIDYKNVSLLQRLTSAQGKLFSRKRTGLSAPAQRRMTLALKRARFIGLMPYVS